MTSIFKTAALAATIAIGATSAYAATVTIDFTDIDSYDTFSATSATGQLGTSLDWTATPTPAEGPLRRTAFDGDNDPVGTPLSFDDFDGLGVVDDEASFPDQFITVKFQAGFRVTGLHFLDVFGGEGVNVYYNGSLTPSATFGTTTASGDNTFGGYLFAKIDETISSITFGAIGVNDNGVGAGVGSPDIALAGIDIFSRDGNEPEPVPLPAGGALLLTALGGLAVARRRKARKAA